MNNSISIKGFTDNDTITKLIELMVNSSLNYEKKSSLITKFLSEKTSDNESFDAEIKKNIFISLFENEEFVSRFLKDNFYYLAIYARFLPEEYQQRIRIIRTAIDKETQTQIDHQNSTQGTQTQISIRNQGIQTSEDLEEFASASNPKVEMRLEE
jgi:hypothetical protein